MRRLLFEVGMAAVMLFWGYNYVNVKFGSLVWSAPQFTWIRFLILSVVFVLWLRLAGKPWPTREDLRRYIPLGLVGVTSYQTLFVASAHYTTAGATALLLAMSPVFAALWATVTGKGKPGARQWAGIGLSLLGVLFVVTHSPQARTAPDPLLGDALGLLASLSWAAYTWYSRPVLETRSPEELTGWTAVTGFLGVSLLLPFFGWPPLTTVPWVSWAALLYVLGPVSLFGLVFWQVGIKAIGATGTLVYLNAVPLVAAVSAHLVLKEPLTTLEAVGGVAILLGVTLTRSAPAAAPPSLVEGER